MPLTLSVPVRFRYLSAGKVETNELKRVFTEKSKGKQSARQSWLTLDSSIIPLPLSSLLNA